MKEFGPFRLDCVNQCLWRRDDSGEDERILLKPTEFGVLDYLTEHAGRLVTHDELLDAVWPRMAIEPQAVKSKVFHLRRVLGDDSRQPRFIETVQRRGYRFVAALGSPTAEHENGAGSPTAIVGREQTLNDLWHRLRTARGGKLEVVFLTGEPGIGKTAVVDEFCNQVALRDRTVRIARGQCVEGFGSKEAFYPVLGAVAQLCEGADSARVVDTLAARAPTWLVQFPALLTERHRETLKQEILGATRERMLREIADALEMVARGTPLLIVVEDLHWADPSTLDLISALARHREPARIMVVATYRSTDVTRSTQPLHALKRDLVARQLGHEIVLEPLDETDLVQYLAARGASAAAASQLATVLHRHTEGNPLFVLGMLEHLLRREIVDMEGGWRLTLDAAETSLDVPESLRQMISAQIDRLTDDEQQVLEVGSIAGMSFAPMICALTADLKPDECEGCCDALVRRGEVLRLDSMQQLPNGSIVERYAFVHALYREVLYQRQPPARRATLHRRRAERLEELFRSSLGDVTSELAHHFEKGADWTRAVQYRRRAADLAVRRYALEEARANLEQALDLAGRLPLSSRAAVETEILESLSEMDVVTFDPRGVETLTRLREVAARNGFVEAEAKALVNQVLPLAWMDGMKALDVIDQALRLSDGKLDPLVRARIRAACLHRRIGVRGWNAADALDCAAAMEEIQRRGTTTDVAWHMVDCSFVDYYRSEYRAAHANALASLSALTSGDDANAYLKYAVAHWNCDTVVPWSLNLLGEWGAALQELDTRIARAERNADAHRTRLLLLSRARVQLNAMDFAAARATTLALLPMLPSGREDPLRRLCLVVAGASEAGLGHFDEAIEHLLTARREIDERLVIVDWYHRLMLQWALTNLWIDRGDLERARDEGRLFIECAAATVEQSWRALAWESNARIALAWGDVQSASRFAEQAVQAVTGVEAPVAGWQAYATAASVAQARGEGESAARHLETSRRIVLRLATSLGSHEALRQTFLGAPPVQRVLGGAVNARRLFAETFNNQTETAR